MSDYDRFASARYGAGVARSGTGAIDQGLRAYMLGVYNYMTLGLGVTGLVAFVAYKARGGRKRPATSSASTGFGDAIYRSPLRWVVIFAPLLVVFGLSAGRDRMSASAARLIFLAFAALMGLSLSTCSWSTRGRRSRACSSYGGLLRRAEPLRLHHPARSLGDGLVPDDGRVRPHHREPGQHLPASTRPAVGAVGARRRHLRRPDRL